MNKLRWSFLLCGLLLFAFDLSSKTLLFAEEKSGLLTESADRLVAARRSKSRKEVLASIEVGPFELKRKYRSMEGPYSMLTFRVGDLIASGHIQAPSSLVTYLDPGESVSMQKSETSVPGKETGQAKKQGEKKIQGLKSTADCPRALLWLRGLKLEVLDEKNKIMPSAEFICHMNLDVDRTTRFIAFPSLEKTGSSRLFTLTQGQTAFRFPENCAVPVASDEEWTFTFQAANRTSQKERSVKHLLTLYFSLDEELKNDVHALHWYNPYITVLTEENKQPPAHHGPSCLVQSSGSPAPNMVPGSHFTDGTGRVLAGHWVVPPGENLYVSPLNNQTEPGFSDQERLIQAVWTHVHPACTKALVLECDNAKKRRIFEVGVKTSFDSGPELRKIENLVSERGIKLAAGKNYELQAQYKNPLREDLDSMVALGLFCRSKTFSRPDWSLEDANDAKSNSVSFSKLSGRNAVSKGSDASQAKCDDIYCGIKPTKPD